MSTVDVLANALTTGGHAARTGKPPPSVPGPTKGTRQ